MSKDRVLERLKKLEEIIDNMSAEELMKLVEGKDLTKESEYAFLESVVLKGDKDAK